MTLKRVSCYWWAMPLLAVQSGDKGRLLSDLVKGRCSPRFNEQCLCRESLADALKMQPSLSAIESVVTQDGIWLGNNWLRVARDKDATAGVLQRKQELETIVAELEQLDNSIGELEKTRQTNEQRMQSLEQNRQEIAANISQQQASYTDLRSKLTWL